MDVSQPNEESHTGQAKAKLAAVLSALIPTGLLYLRKDLEDLDEKQRKELLHDVFGPGDLDLRLGQPLSGAAALAQSSQSR